MEEDQHRIQVGSYPLIYNMSDLSESMLIDLLDRDIRFELADDVREYLEQAREEYDDECFDDY